MFCRGSLTAHILNSYHPTIQFLSRLAAALLLVSLVACSDSADSDLDGPASALPSDSALAEPEDFFIFDDIAYKAASKYQGATTEKGFSSKESISAALTNSLFGAFGYHEDIHRDQSNYYNWLSVPWSSLTTDIPLLDVNADRRSLVGTGTKQCDSNSGTAYIEREAGTLETGEDVFFYTFNYRNCKASNAESHFTGVVKVLFVRERNETINHLLVAYDDVTISKGGRSAAVTGVVRVLDPLACGPEGDRVHYLTVTDKNTGKSVFLENYSLGRYDREGQPCSGYSADANYFRGKIYNSEYGVFQVNTPEPLGDNIYSYPKQTPYQFPNDARTFSAGELEIISRTDELTVGLTNDHFVPDEQSLHVSSGAVQLAVADSTNLQNYELQFNRALFHWGSFLDLSDDDADGMNNSWENLVGLNSNDQTDSNDDEDADSRPAILEYQTGGDPLSGKIKGSSIDRRVEFEIRHSKYWNGDVTVLFTTQTDNYDPLLESSQTTFKFDVAGDWDGVDAHCEVSDENALMCESRSYQSGASFRPHADGVVTLQTGISNSEHDIDISNHQITHEIDFAKTQTDYELNASAESVARSTGEHTISAQVTNNFIYSYSPVVVEVSIPEGVTITKAEAGLNGATKYYNCDITDMIICSPTSLLGSKTFDVEITFTTESAEEVLFRWLVQSQPFEIIKDNNISTTRVIRAQPASELLPLFDAAQDGEEVTLPPGDFEGHIFIDRKSLTISGSTEGSPTRFHTFRDYDYSLTYFGDHTVIRNIEFIGPGTPIIYNNGDFLTITDNKFFPSTSSADANSLLVSSAYPRFHDPIVRDASYRFYNNEVHGFGKEEGSRCSKLLSALNWRAIFVEGNTFSRLECEEGLIAGSNDLEGSGSVLMEFNNNTLYDVSTVFGLNFDSTNNLTNHFYVHNNIKHGVGTLLDISPAAYYGSTESTFNTFNNLVLNADNSESESVELTNDHTTIWADPLFVNPASRQFFLKPDSPAIDQSKSIANRGFYGSALIDAEKSHFVHQYLRSAQDGNYDGVSEADIGAVEFSP